MYPGKPILTVKLLQLVVKTLHNQNYVTVSYDRHKAPITPRGLRHPSTVCVIPFCATNTAITATSKVLRIKKQKQKKKYIKKNKKK